MAFPAETTEAFLEGHNQAFALFRRSAARDSIRQHQAGGGSHSGRWHPPQNAGLQWTAESLLVSREVRTPGHPRYEREDVIFEPRHYLALLEQKSNALDQAAPLEGWKLPVCFAEVRQLLEVRLQKKGKREYIQVLRSLEVFTVNEAERAIEEALQLGAISFDAVKHLLLSRIEQRPARLDLENHPHLPVAEVATTLAADYLTLLSGGGH